MSPQEVSALAQTSTFEQFVSTLGHDLRTPLNVILGYTAMLLEDAKFNGQEATAQDLQKIESSGQSLLASINQLVDIAKWESGCHQCNKETFAVGEFLHQVIALTRAQEATFSTAITVDLEPGLEMMNSDSAVLGNILSYLLNLARSQTATQQIRIVVNREVVEIPPSLMQQSPAKWMVWEFHDDGKPFSSEQSRKLSDSYGAPGHTVPGGLPDLGFRLTERQVWALEGCLELGFDDLCRFRLRFPQP